MVVLFKIVTYTDLCLSYYLHVCVCIVSLPMQTQVWHSKSSNRAEFLTEKLTVSHSAGSELGRQNVKGEDA